MPKKKKTRKKKKTTNKRGSDISIPKMSKTNVPPSKIRRIISFVLQALGVWGVFLTIWVVVTPRVFVYPRDSLDPNNPVYTFFAVRNEGYLDISDVTIECSVKYLELPGNIQVIGLGDYTNRFSDPTQVASVIAPGEEYSILLPLSGLKHDQIENMDIAIVLSYRQSGWLFWRRKGLERLYRFVSKQAKDGQWHWFQQPIKK